MVCLGNEQRSSCHFWNCIQVLHFRLFCWPCYHFALSYCSWGSQGKNTEMVCHSLFQGTTFCHTSPPWPVHLGWPYTAWLSFTELDKAVVHVIRLASCLWLWFPSICPLMPYLIAYRLAWVSLRLDVGYLFTAAPAKCSVCALPRTWSSSSWPRFCAVHRSHHNGRFILGDWNAKVGSQETPGVTGKFGLGAQNKAGQRVIELCQENALVIANTLFQQHKRRLYTWTSPDGGHWNQTDYILWLQRI